MEHPRSLDAAFSTFDARWEPRIVAHVNDYDVKIAKVEGDYVEHAHAATDEYFHVLAGELVLDLPEQGRSVTLRAGDVFTVPRGVRHRPRASPGTRILMFEPRGTVNAGDADVEGTGGVALGEAS